MNGVERIVTINTKQACGHCRGSGAREGTSWSVCKLCKGNGVQRVERGILSMGLPCNNCHGVGEVLDHPCHSCRGAGTRVQPRDVRVNVPAGVKSQMELRIPGAGHAGERGGKAGHLFVTVKVEGHPRFRHIDDDVHVDVPLTLRQSLLGGDIEVPTLSGSSEFLGLGAPTQPGSTRLLRGRGPPRLGGEGRGSLVLHFLLRLPTKVSQRQVALIEEFDALAKEQEDESTPPNHERRRARQ